MDTDTTKWLSGLQALNGRPGRLLRPPIDCVRQVQAARWAACRANHISHPGGTVSHHLDSPASRQDPRLNLTFMPGTYFRALSIAGIVCSIPREAAPHLMCG
jgi:hypothetical protein